MTTLIADVGFFVFVPKHDLRRKSAFAKLVAELLRQLGFGGSQCVFGAVDLFLGAVGIGALRHLGFDTLENLDNGSGGREVFGEITYGQ